MFAVENKHDIGDLKELPVSKSKIKPVRLKENFGKHKFHSVTKQLFEASTKFVADERKELIKETKSAKKAIESLTQTKITSSEKSQQKAFDQKNYISCN